MSMFGFQIGGDFLSFFGGPPGSARGTSNCGRDWDAYVKRVEGPFPYDHRAPVTRELRMWHERRCRIYFSPTDFRRAKVVMWEQSNHGPFSSTTKWTLTVHYLNEDGEEGYAKGDIVDIDGKPKKHDGKRGRIVAVMPSGKFKVRLDEDSIVFVMVAAENLRKLNIYYDVHRMNITGGGIIVEGGDEDGGDVKMSLEWIDPPDPPIPSDLYSNVVNINCPTCRAVEPNEIAFDDTTVKLKLHSDVCPVCTEPNKLSRTLQCGHVLCNDCFRQWRDKGNSKIPSTVSEPHIDPTRLQRERDSNFQKLRAILPATVMNGTATTRSSVRRTRSSNTRSAADDAMERFRDRIKSTLQELDDLAHPSISRNNDRGDILTADESLTRYWTKLRQMSIHFLCEQSIAEELLDELNSKAAVEILMRVTEERADGIVSGLQTLGLIKPEDVAAGDEEKWAQGYVEHLCSKYCNRMGELYEDEGNYRSAIHWYDRAILHSRKRKELQPGSVEECNAVLSMFHNNLGVAQRRAGMLNAAMESYNIAIGLHPSDQTAVNNMERLNMELEQWTGTSGKLTPP